MIQQGDMLRAAAFGMLIYGVHDFIVGATDLIGVGMLEWWANLWRILSGGVLTLAAALVRVSLPGGLALAVSGLLALQSINLHNDPHVYVELPARATVNARCVQHASGRHDLSGMGGAWHLSWRNYAQPLVAPQFTHL